MLRSRPASKPASPVSHGDVETSVTDTDGRSHSGSSKVHGGSRGRFSKCKCLLSFVGLIGIGAIFIFMLPFHAADLLSSSGITYKSQGIEKPRSLIVSPNGGKSLALSDESLVQSLIYMPVRLLGYSVSRISYETLSEIRNARSGLLPEGFRPDESHLHGLLGLSDDGISGWRPDTTLPEWLTTSADGNVAPIPSEMSLVQRSAKMPLDLGISSALDSTKASVCEGEIKTSELANKNGETVSVVYIISDPVVTSMLFRSIHSILNNSPPDELETILIVFNGAPRFMNMQTASILKNRPDGNWTSDETDLLGSAADEFTEYHKLLPKTKVRVRTYNVRQDISSIRSEVAKRLVSSPIIVFMESFALMTQPGWISMVSSLLKSHPMSFLAFPYQIVPEDADSAPSIIGCNKELDLGLNAISVLESEEANTSSTVKAAPVMFADSFALYRATLTAPVFDDLSVSPKIGNVDLVDVSLKAWMCAGGIYCSDCLVLSVLFSGQIVRFNHGGMYSQDNEKNLLLAKYFDEFAAPLWMLNSLPQINKSDPNVSEAFDFKSKYKCRPFLSYKTEELKHFPLNSPSDDIAYVGLVVHGSNTSCLTSLDDAYLGTNGYVPHRVVVATCAESEGQLFAFLRSSGALVPVGTPSLTLALATHNMSEVGYASFDAADAAARIAWTYSSKGHLQDITTGHCLSATSSDALLMEKCRFDDPDQTWHWLESRTIQERLSEMVSEVSYGDLDVTESSFELPQKSRSAGRTRPVSLPFTYPHRRSSPQVHSRPGAVRQTRMVGNMRYKRFGTIGEASNITQTESDTLSHDAVHFTIPSSTTPVADIPEIDTSDVTDLKNKEDSDSNNTLNSEMR